MVRCGGGEVSPPPVLLCPQCPWAGSSQVFLIPPSPALLSGGTGGRGWRRALPSPGRRGWVSRSPEVRLVKSPVLTLVFQMAPFPPPARSTRGFSPLFSGRSCSEFLGGKLTGAWAPLRTGSPEFLCSQRLVHPEPLASATPWLPAVGASCPLASAPSLLR